jgi:GNAT superfamily N-acetyltransferase
LIVLHIVDQENWMRWRDVRLEALREAPYAFGATLANWRDAQESRWRNRLREVPCNILAELDGATVGMVSGTAPLNGEVMLISMWVAPSARGKGGGDALVGAIPRMGAAAGCRSRFAPRSRRQRTCNRTLPAQRLR